MAVPHVGEIRRPGLPEYSSRVRTHHSGRHSWVFNRKHASTCSLGCSFLMLTAWLSHNWILFPTQQFLLLLPTLALLVSSAVLEPWRKTDLQNSVISAPSPWKSPLPASAKGSLPGTAFSCPVSDGSYLFPSWSFLPSSVTCLVFWSVPSSYNVNPWGSVWLSVASYD